MKRNTKDDLKDLRQISKFLNRIIKRGGKLNSSAQFTFESLREEINDWRQFIRTGGKYIEDPTNV